MGGRRTRRRGRGAPASRGRALLPRHSTPADAPPAPPEPWRKTLAFDSIESLRRVITRDAPVVATSSETVQGTFGTARIGGLRLSFGDLAGSVLSGGYTAADEVTGTVVLSARLGSINGVPLEPGTVLVFRPRALYQGWSGPGYRWLTFHLPRSAVAALDLPDMSPLLDLAGAGLLVARLSPAQLRWARTFERDLLAADVPDGAAPPEALERAAGAWAPLLAGWWRRAKPVRRSERHRAADAAVERAAAYVEARLSERIRSEDLSRVARVPERTLEYGFRRRFGISPLRYVLVVRLLAAKRLLLERTGRSTGGVADVSAEVGLHHRGRFADAYREMFGETPTEALRRARGLSPPQRRRALAALAATR